MEICQALKHAPISTSPWLMEEYFKALRSALAYPFFNTYTLWSLRGLTIADKESNARVVVLEITEACRALELEPNLTSHKQSQQIFQKVLKPDYLRISFIIFHVIVITENWIFQWHVILSYFTSFFQSVGKETVSVTYSSHLLFWFQDDFHWPTYSKSI